jgi:hypothetical protein
MKEQASNYVFGVVAGHMPDKRGDWDTDSTEKHTKAYEVLQPPFCWLAVLTPFRNPL